MDMTSQCNFQHWIPVLTSDPGADPLTLSKPVIPGLNPRPTELTTRCLQI